MAVALTPKRLYTEEDLEALSAQGHRYELIWGELHPMSPASGDHGRATWRLEQPLSAYVAEHDLGECVAAETGFTLAKDPDLTLAPDWAFLRAEALAQASPGVYLRIMPEIVLETRSPSDRSRKVEEKIRLWLEAGVKVVLDLDPGGGQLAVWRADQTPQLLGRQDDLELPDVFPGLSVPLIRVFPAS